MSDNTKIEWTDATWSPTLGCTRVSAGCDGCYAIRTVHRMAHNPTPKIAAAAAGLTEHRDGRLDWTGAVNTLPGRLTLPLHWKKPRRIFVDSQSDLFHDDVPDEFIVRVFAVMAATPQHTYQILTKRHARMRSFVRRLAFAGPTREERAASITGRVPYLFEDGNENQRIGAVRPLANVWLGVSVENQQWADIRIPVLLETPAAVRFLSCEPLLGPVDLGIGDPHRNHDSDDVHGYPHPRVCLTCSTEENEVEYFRREPGGFGIDWVIVGGESGRDARPMHPAWARSLRDQCVEAGVAFHFKQWGEWAPESVCASRNGAAGALYIEHDGSTRPAARGARGNAVTVQRNGKKLTGRKLDGRTWDQYPGTDGRPVVELPALAEDGAR